MLLDGVLAELRRMENEKQQMSDYMEKRFADYENKLQNMSDYMENRLADYDNKLQALSDYMDTGFADYEDKLERFRNLDIGTSGTSASHEPAPSLTTEVDVTAAPATTAGSMPASWVDKLKDERCLRGRR
jgi:hypothetical protein